MKKFVALLSLWASVLMAGPEVRVVPDQLYFPTLLEALSKAQKCIDILQFSFAIGDGKGNLATSSDPYRVALALAELQKANPKLRIRLYIESERDTAARNHETVEFLKKAGIDVKEGATHAKGFAIDDGTLLLGSTNLTTQSLRYNNETNILLNEHPEIVMAFREYFDMLWSDQPRTSEAKPALPVEGVQLLTDGKYKQAILDAIGQATKSIDFSIYYFNDTDIEQALIAAAKKVKVRGYINQHKTFGLDLVARNKRTLERLRAGGVSSVYLDLDTFFSHSKYLIVDGERILLGTGNWNKSDIETHPQLYLSVKNSRWAEKLSRHLSHQIAYEGTREKPASLYYRFWIGWKKPELSFATFDETIRDRFVRATVLTGQRGGLVGYLPVLTAKSHAQMPDEVALVVYQDEPTYRAIRESALGAVYGPLHFDYFDSASKSAVPQAIGAKADLNAAYQWTSPDVDWQAGSSLFVLSRSSGKVDLPQVAAYLSELVAKKPAALDGYLVYVGKDFLVEYFHRAKPWTSAQWKQIAALRSNYLVKSYDEPDQVEAAFLSAADDNGISRPLTVPQVSFEAKKGAAITSSVFEPAIDAKTFLNQSLKSFSRSEAEDNQLARDIKAAFVNGTAIPSK